MLKEQREEILNDLVTESFLTTESEPLSEQDAKRLKDYLIKVRKSIIEKESINKKFLWFNTSDESFEKKIDKFIEKAKEGKYYRTGFPVFGSLSTNFISFKEAYKHSNNWYVEQVMRHYDLNKLCNMNPCKDKFSLKLIQHTGDSDYFSLELGTLV